MRRLITSDTFSNKEKLKKNVDLGFKFDEMRSGKLKLDRGNRIEYFSFSLDLLKCEWNAT